jgi:hypothetical protein
MSNRRATGTAAIFAAVLLALPSYVAAQGNGRPKGPRAQPAPTTTPAPDASSTGASVPVSSFRQFGSWLDDASGATPGETRTGFGVGYWRMPGASQTNVPMFDAGYGVNTRLQVSASVPFYRSTYEGATVRGLDDVYLSAKYTLIDPGAADARFGLAVSPVVEVLSAGAPDGRLHFAVPVNVELRQQAFRVYASAGYFTRGSFFTSGAVEVPTSTGLVYTLALTQSISTRHDPQLDALAVSKRRVDLTAGAGYLVTPMAAVYGSMGRTLTSIEEGGTSLALSGGISFRFTR